MDWNDRLWEASRKLADAFWSDSLKSDPDGSVAVLEPGAAAAPCRLGAGGILRQSGNPGSRTAGSGIWRIFHGFIKRWAGFFPMISRQSGVCSRRTGPTPFGSSRFIVRPAFPLFPPGRKRFWESSRPMPRRRAIRSLKRSSPAAWSLAPRRRKSALRHLQENLFLTGPSKVALDDSVTCLGVRDSLEAAEIAAGMIQKALDGDSRLKTSEIGLLLPGDGSCEDAVREVFSRAGLPVSGLEGSPRLRNLGGEAVFLFLATRRRPAPAMALAAIYSSPLMPWDAVIGNRLAMRIMDGKFDLEAPAEMSAEARRMMDLLRKEHDTPRSLAKR